MKTDALSNFFNGNTRYFIPGYQRGYSWQKKQIDDFFRDINLIADDYYTGLITTKQLSNGLLEVVDGQQRLTTIIMTVSALLKSKIDDTLYGTPKGFIEYQFIKNKDGYILSYESESDSEFLKKILDGGRLVGAKRNNIYQRNLISAAALIKKYVQELKQSEIDSFFMKMMKCMHFHHFKIDSDKVSCQMFESINFRGIDLTRFEVLKNRLMSISYLLSDDGVSNEILRKSINSTWSNCYSSLGANIKLINEDSFLRVHSLYYHKIGNSSVEEVLLNEIYSISNSAKINQNLISEYLLSLGEAAEIYSWMSCLNANISIKEFKKLERQIEKNRRIGFGNFEALILCALQKLKSQIIAIDDAIRLLKSCERYCFIIFGLIDKRSDHQKSVHNRLAWKLYWDEIAIDDVISEVNNSIDDEDGVYWKAGFETIVGAVKSRFSNQGGYYVEWKKELKYLLAEWEEFNGNVISDLDVLEIEHIFPQDPKGESLAIYNKWSKKGVHNYYVHDLGNLGLIEPELNVQALNNEFAYKKMIYKKSAFLKDVKLFENWTADEITARGRSIINFIWSHWNFPIDQDENYSADKFLAINMKGVKERII